MYAIVDIETTGGKYNEEGITDIAIYKFDGHDTVDQLISLVNPERPIQPFVVKLTGINSKMLRNAPKFYDIAKRIIEITKDCIIVAHNAQFDFRILQTEFKRLGYDFQRDTLCTVELTRALIPDLDSYSLGKLCKSLGIPMTLRHRAEGDALATVQLFKLLLTKDTDKEIIKKSAKIIKPRKSLAPKLTGLLDKIPQKAGVFYMHKENGDIMYIGNASNMRKSVNKLFLKETKTAKKIQSQISEITYEKTGSSLISSLKYYSELEQNKPEFNFRRNLKTNPTSFSNPNMILIDKGRDIGEKSVLLIKDNAFKGYGYVNLEHQINNIDILENLLQHLPNSEKNQYIINNFLKKSRLEKIIRF